MNFIKLYFELKIFGLIVISIMVICIAIFSIITSINDRKKEEMLINNGFKYLKGLSGGQYVAKEFRPHYKKNEKEILLTDVNKYSYKKLKQWIDKEN